MTFLAMAIQRGLLVQERAQYQFQLIQLTNENNDLEDEIAAFSREDGADEAVLDYLEAEKEAHDIQIQHCEDMLTTISAELESYKDEIKNNVKSECSFKLSGG